MSLKRALRSFITDERGQSTTEYILIMAVVVMVAMKFREMFQGKMKTMLDNLGQGLDKGTRIDDF